MRRRFAVIMPIIIMVIVAIACIVTYLIATNQIKLISLKSANLNMVQNTTNSNSDDIVLAKNELPRLDASVVAQPLMTSIIKNFTCSDDIQNSILNYTDTNIAMQKLLNDEIDAVIAPYPSDEILSLADARNLELEIIPIAKEAFVFYVNKSNPIDSIKVSDIQKIYIGEIKNWSQIGGENAEIIAFQRPNSSINQMEMNRTVMKGLQMISAPKDVFHDSVYGEITDLIANYNNQENGIGYSYYTEASLLYDCNNNVEESVKLLKINDIEASLENIENGTYPLITKFYLIKNKNSESEHLQIFMDSLLSERGKNAIKEAGYINE